MTQEAPDPKNFHTISEKRKELRASLKGQKSESVRRSVTSALEEVKRAAGEFSIEKEGGLSKAKERLVADKERAEQSVWLDEKAIAVELGPEKYEEFTKLTDELESLTDFEFQRLRSQTANLGAKRSQQELLKTIRSEKSHLAGALESMREAEPVFTHALELVAYKRGLHREGHIAPVPSVTSSLNEIGSRMISGKPIFLHGPTGTGKTSLARYAAQHFAGKNAEMVYCNPQTRESSIWGKTGIRPAASGAIETVDIYGPLARAMHDGTPVIFDEFTALPKEQMVFIKGVFNAKPGDSVNMMGNGIVAIKPGFQMIFTANLKSEKNPERAELPPEIAREFEQNNLEIDYTPPDEAYDIMLARLMNPDGSVDLSYHDLNETLPKFCEAMREIQIAYTDTTPTETARLTGTLDASGKRHGLKKLVLTQGTVENVLDGWDTEKQINTDHPSFTEFLDRRLKTALTFREYPEADRILAAKILASKGLLRTVTPSQLGLASNLFDFDAAKRLRGDKNSIAELTAESAQEEHVPLREIAVLDPFGRRARKAATVATQFLPEDEKTSPAGAIDLETIAKKSEAFFRATMGGWGYDAATQEKFIANQKPELIDPKTVHYAEKKDDIVATKFGEYTLNPYTVSIDWESVPLDNIEVKKLPENLEGKPLHEVAQYVMDTYSKDYHIPGIEYWKYIADHPDQAPAELKDGNYHFLFGSIFRHANGRWYVPCVYGRTLDRHGYWLGSVWYSSCRVVLLKK